MSAKILSVAMVLEVAIVMVFNVAVVLRGGGATGYSAAPINPANLSHGDFGIALLFAIMIFLGFEATALFRDEVRTPIRRFRERHTVLCFSWARCTRCRATY